MKKKKHKNMGDQINTQRNEQGKYRQTKERTKIWEDSSNHKSPLMYERHVIFARGGVW